MADSRQNGTDEDDDFGDFGGFEAAEPVAPSVADVQPSGVEASPSPWAILGLGGSDSVGARPDLLCGQNRFPPLLDPSVPAPAEGATAGPSENNVNAIASAFPAESAGELGQVANFDEASYVNDILDGSFRSSASGNSGASRSHPSAGPTPSNHSNSAESAASTLDLVPPSSRGSVGQGQGQVTAEISSRVKNKLEMVSKTGGKPDVANEPVVGGIMVVEVDSQEELSESGTSNGKASSSPVPHKPTVTGQLLVTGQATEKGTKSEEQLDSVPSGADNSVLTCPVYSPKVHESWSDNSHIKDELESLRKESKLAVQAVVTEYTALMNKTLSEQQAVLQRHLQEVREEQGKQLQLQLEKQVAMLEEMFSEEKKKLMEEMQKETQIQLQSQKEQFEKHLEEERDRSKERVEEALQNETEANKQRLDSLMVEEKEKTSQALQDQKEEFEKLLQEERGKSSADLQKLLEEERKKFKEELQSAVEEERTKHQTYFHKVMELAKEEVQSYLTQQQELDRVVRHRQLSSLDVFLESARGQLSLLLTNENVQEPQSKERKSPSPEEGNS